MEFRVFKGRGGEWLGFFNSIGDTVAWSETVSPEGGGILARKVVRVYRIVGGNEVWGTFRPLEGRLSVGALEALVAPALEGPLTLKPPPTEPAIRVGYEVAGTNFGRHSGIVVGQVADDEWEVAEYLDKDAGKFSGLAIYAGFELRVIGGYAPSEEVLSVALAGLLRSAVLKEQAATAAVKNLRRDIRAAEDRQLDAEEQVHAAQTLLSSKWAAGPGSEAFERARRDQIARDAFGYDEEEDDGGKLFGKTP